MGAGDPDNVTSWFLSNFVNELKNEEIYVLLGGAYKYKKQIYKIDFCIIWQLGGFGMVQNTRMGYGNDLPARGTNFEKHVCF